VIYLIDGSNLLGRAGLDRHAVEEKRRLIPRLAAFGRSARVKVLCFFDGVRPDAFSTSLGGLQIAFSGNRPADDLIVERARAAREPVRVVTADQELAARVRGRQVIVLHTREFIPLLEAGEGESTARDIDWETYFSDPNNREAF
jgi:hypothetical protein